MHNANGNQYHLGGSYVKIGMSSGILEHVVSLTLGPHYQY